MDPITTAAIWVILTLVFINLFRRPRAASAIAPATTPKALSGVASPEHRLLKTYIEKEGDGVIRGWRAKCSCGATNYATNATNAVGNKRATFGTEESAIDAHEGHAKNFNRVNGNPLSAKLEDLQKELDDYKKACFCHDVSTVKLLPLKG